MYPPLFASFTGNQYVGILLLEVKLVSKAQPKATNNREVVFTLATKGRKHILMA